MCFFKLYVLELYADVLKDAMILRLEQEREIYEGGSNK